ncbi:MULTISPECIES: bacteriocin [unclassified Staphylococcus]|nr:MULTISPECIES: bacteriocin [unclassified Staphylococcus]
MKTLNSNELKNINGGDVWRDIGKATREVLPIITKKPKK